METFPTISILPSTDGYSEEKAYDPVIKSRSEAGYLKTRARTYRTTLPKKYKIVYQPLPDYDKGLIEAFENTVMCGSDAFTFTLFGSSKTVRFVAPVKYTLPFGNKVYWRAEFEIEEV